MVIRPTIPENSRPSRIRILVATHEADDEIWEHWQAARQASPHASRIALQRVFRNDEACGPKAVGLGYGETLRWFGPVDDADKRRLTMEYAGVGVLASNLRQNIDEAFLRRIHVIVEFPSPDADARMRIWKGMFPQGIQ